MSKEWCCETYREWDAMFGGILLLNMSKEGEVRTILREESDFDYCPYCGESLE